MPYGNLAPGSNSRVASATLTRRVVFAAGGALNSGELSVDGLTRYSFFVVQTGGVPGAEIRVELQTQGQNWLVIDSINIAAVNTPFALGRHIAGSLLRVSVVGAVAGATYNGELVLSGTS
jgi:hypothetical protein